MLLLASGVNDRPSYLLKGIRCCFFRKKTIHSSSSRQSCSFFLTSWALLNTAKLLYSKISYSNETSLELKMALCYSPSLRERHCSPSPYNRSILEQLLEKWVIFWLSITWHGMKCLLPFMIYWRQNGEDGKYNDTVKSWPLLRIEPEPLVKF